jgi:hypothetical protein
VRHYSASVPVSFPGIKMFPLHWQSAMRSLYYIAKDGSTRNVDVPRNSLLGEWFIAGEWLAGRYQWDEATRFILTGETRRSRR